MYGIVTPQDISISAGIAKCANRCLFCQLNDLRPVTFDIKRFMGVVDKFWDYKVRTGLGIDAWVGFSYDLSISDFAIQKDLYSRNGWGVSLVQMGGMPVMDDATLLRWFQERKNIGIKDVYASYYGLAPYHDYLNDMPGNFDYMLKSQILASKVGLHNGQRIMLTKSALPDLARLLEILDEPGAVSERVAYPLFYSGYARNFEHERPTKADLDAQPETVQAAYRGDRPNWKSESEWIEWIRADKEQFSMKWLLLQINDENIAALEKMSCDEIIADLTERTNRAYAAVPSSAELAEKYSDPLNDKVYMFLWDMECLWVDRFLARNPHIQFERHLTHFGR